MSKVLQFVREGNARAAYTLFNSSSADLQLLMRQRDMSTQSD